MTIKLDWSEGMDYPEELKPGKCLSSVPCGDDSTFEHKEHSLCLRCKRRVPVPLNARAIMNSVSSCEKCRTEPEERAFSWLALKMGEIK